MIKIREIVEIKVWFQTSKGYSISYFEKDGQTEWTIKANSKTDFYKKVTALRKKLGVTKRYVTSSNDWQMVRSFSGFWACLCSLSIKYVKPVAKITPRLIARIADSMRKVKKRRKRRHSITIRKVKKRLNRTSARVVRIKRVRIGVRILVFFWVRGSSIVFCGWMRAS